MLINDHFQNFKSYQIPKAQLVIADIPYNIGKNYCGTCKHFGFQDACGQGVCTLFEFGTECGSKACGEWEEEEEKVNPEKCENYGSKRCALTEQPDLYAWGYCYNCFD